MENTNLGGPDGGVYPITPAQLADPVYLKNAMLTNQCPPGTPIDTVHGGGVRCLQPTIEEAATMCDKDPLCVGITSLISKEAGNTGYEPRNNLVGTSGWPGSTTWMCVPNTSPTGKVYCLMEVGDTQVPKNIWKVVGSQYWEAGAPPVGSGVYWIWGTPDGHISRPVNESFSFYTVYNNPSSAITAILIGAVDNIGYVKINGKKYPPQDTWSPEYNAFYGFATGIPSTQVTLDAGVNIIEFFCQNGYLNPSPAACWLTISANGQILVKTDCTNWSTIRPPTPPASPPPATPPPATPPPATPPPAACPCPKCAKCRKR